MWILILMNENECTIYMFAKGFCDICECYWTHKLFGLFYFKLHHVHCFVCILVLLFCLDCLVSKKLNDAKTQQLWEPLLLFYAAIVNVLWKSLGKKFSNSSIHVWRGFKNLAVKECEVLDWKYHKNECFQMNLEIQKYNPVLMFASSPLPNLYGSFLPMS